MVKDYASSRWWTHIGGPNVGFIGASRKSSCLTKTSEYSWRKYSLAAAGDVVLSRGSGGDATWGGVATASICLQLCGTPFGVASIDSLTGLTILLASVIYSRKSLGTMLNSLQCPHDSRGLLKDLCKSVNLVHDNLPYMSSALKEPSALGI